MRYNWSVPLLATFFILIVLGNASMYVVPEGWQALRFRFGKIVGEPKTQAGLYFKWPFIEEVQPLDKRILNWDGIPERVPTGDKKYIIVDTTARYKIVDALKFRNSLENITRAQSRIKNVIDSATRDIISSHNLVETVRNTNAIIDETAEYERLREKARDAGTLDLLEEEITGDIPKVYVGREQLSRQIIEIARLPLKQFGIDLIDVQLRRIAYEESVQDKVYDRMISERERIAEKIISYGKGEQAKIRGRKERELRKIRSEAYKEVQKIKGRAEAEAIKIYAEAMEQDEDFYEFLRTIELYQNGIRNDTKMILSADSEFLKLLMDGVKPR